MTKEDEKAEWRRRQKIKPPAPRILHESKTFSIVRTETFPEVRFGPGRTYIGAEATQRRIDERIARQQLHDKQMIERANKTIDQMESQADEALASLTEVEAFG